MKLDYVSPCVGCVSKNPFDPEEHDRCRYCGQGDMRRTKIEWEMLNEYRTECEKIRKRIWGEGE